MIKRYSELKNLITFEDRFEYLAIHDNVGFDTFGFDRYLNQQFYKSAEWKRIRDYVIVRDNGKDLGIVDRDICGKIYIHHMNPLVKKDILESTEFLLNPEYLICVSFETHNALHYGSLNSVSKSLPTERHANDTCPWKEIK